jgi:uncharacterized protein (TIGR02996 family)
VVRDRGPLDLSTPVAAGPGPRPPPDFEPSLAEELVAELVPEPGKQSNPSTSKSWLIWADWLQSHGDPRGELVATSHARACRGSRRAWARGLDAARTRVGSRCIAATTAALDYADPLIGNRESPLELRRTHGFITMARLSGLEWGRRSGIVGAARIPAALVEAARALLRYEPLLADLRLGVEGLEAWAILLAGLRSLEPAPRVRRLVLERLPASLPEIAGWRLLFPGLRSLWLLGASKLERGVVRWPGVVELRVRHGDTSEWTHGCIDLELELPDLEHLDFGLPIGGRTTAAEIEGCAATLARLDRVRHLRLRSLGPEFAEAILQGPTILRLRTLELFGVRGQAIDVLIRHAATLRRLERVRVGITPGVAEQRGRELELLRAEVPGVGVEVER